MQPGIVCFPSALLNKSFLSEKLREYQNIDTNSPKFKDVTFPEIEKKLLARVNLFKVQAKKGSVHHRLNFKLTLR